tara:strand:+ start:2027 stop:4981 length:2955 start_codon:yes stop_codon:yes gene_type:complete
MKSFRQKIEERQRIIDAERKLAKETVDRLAYIKKRDDLLEQEQDKIDKNVQYFHDEVARKEAQRLQQITESLNLEMPESEDIILNSEIKEEELKERKRQKDIINEILSGEDQIRETISSTEREVEIDNYEQHQLQKIEDAEKILEQELAEAKAKREQKRLDEVSEQEKLARWKENEKIEEEEKRRMKELREAQEKEKKSKEAAELQEIISSREIYELRQKEIAREQQQNRINVNKILQEAQYILDSEKRTREKNVLSNLQDYIYKLNPTKNNDIWTDRKQPKAILTWEVWKKDSANSILIEQDFKRARLLFEQDNQRAQRYHDHMFQNFAGRYLSLDRKKAIAAAGKLVDIPRHQLISAREELVADIGDIECWLDASDHANLHALVTESINTASVDVSWATPAMAAAKSYQPEAWYESGSLVISGANALFDGDPDTYMSIKHTSASYDWNQPWLDVQGTTNPLNVGVIQVRFTLPEEYDDSLIHRVEVYSTDRKFIPTVTSYWNRNPLHPQGTFERRLWQNKITSSYVGNDNAQLSSGGEHEGTGGIYGITPEGSASLNPMPLGMYPRTGNNTATEGGSQMDLEYGNEYTLFIHIAATGSEVRFNELKIYKVADDSGSAVHGQGVKTWLDKRFYNSTLKSSYGGANPAQGAIWNQASDEYESSRLTPATHPTYFSASIGQPAGITMPYIKFSSQSRSNMRCTTEFQDNSNTDGQTQFFVLRDTSGPYNTTRCIFGDAGASYRQNMGVFISGHAAGIMTQFVDWEYDRPPKTSKNTRHKIQMQNNSLGRGEKDMFGNTLGHNTASNWPYTKGRYPYPGVSENEISIYQKGAMLGSTLKTETQCIVNQLDAPIDGPPSSSKARLWVKGGTPFVDLDAEYNTDYNFTGSNGTPRIGASYNGLEWADMELHEMILFQKCLTTDQIELVSNYLSDKWRIINYPFKSDRNGDFVYGLSSSNSAYDKWSYDGTYAHTEHDTIFSQSGWKIG